jgi:hypothetical protein
MTEKYRDAAEAFADPELFGSAALVLAYDMLGDFFEWEPETIEADLRANGARPGRGCMDRLMAAATVRSSAAFHESLETFMDVCHALNFGRVSASAMSNADLDDVAWGCVEARVIEGTEAFDANGFADDVRLYAGFLLDRAGFDKAPRILDFAELPQGRGADLPLDGTLLGVFASNVAEMTEQLDAGASARLQKLFEQMRRLPLRSGKVPN